MSNGTGTATAPVDKPVAPQSETNWVNPVLDQLREYVADLTKPEAEPDQTPQQSPQPEPGPAPVQATAPDQDGKQKPQDAKPQEQKPQEQKAQDQSKRNKEAGAWALLDRERKKVRELERELEQLRKIKPERVTQLESELKQLRAQNEELQKQIAVLDYTRSPEFQEKYEQPYLRAWKRVMDELKSIRVEDENGGRRTITVEEMQHLVMLPRPAARKLAVELAGEENADLLMEYRNELRNLYDARVEALERAQQQALEWDKQRREQLRQTIEALRETVAQQWQDANRRIAEMEELREYFVPDEQADAEYARRLKRGFEKCDEALSVNIFDPNLTESERERAVQRLAVMRYRAAAFGALKYKYERLKSELEQLRARLGEYESAEPSRRSQATQQSPNAQGQEDVLNQAIQRLYQLAKPSMI